MIKTTAAWACVLFYPCGDHANAAVTFNWATVGNPGNAPDPNHGQGRFGAVANTYRISKNEPRNPTATYFIPSENEWYKAAYYQPAAQGGETDNYWLYPTASNTLPNVATANAIGDISNPGPNVANYFRGADWNERVGNVTTVGGTGPLSASFYGTFDQGGNVWEWNDAVLGSSFRGLRGGYWGGHSFILAAFDRSLDLPTTASSGVGFRIASVPEPSSLLSAAFGMLGLLMGRRRAY